MGINGFPFFVALSMEEFTLGSYSYSSLILQLIVYPAMSHFLKLIIVSQTNNSCSQWRTQKFSKGGERTQDLTKDEGTTGGLGAKSPASNEFLRFSHKKTLIFAHLFVEKGHAVSAVTTHNAKMFSQLMSKSRSLAKISERRLQSLLVCEITD